MNSKRIALLLSVIFLIGVASCGGGKNVKTETTGKKENWGQATGYAQIFDNDSALASMGSKTFGLCLRLSGSLSANHTTQHTTVFFQGSEAN